MTSLCGEKVEEEQGDDIRAAEKALYFAMIEEVEPLDGARDLIADLKRLDRRVVLASSAKPEEVEHYLDLLDARGRGRARARSTPPSLTPTSSRPRWSASAAARR